MGYLYDIDGRLAEIEKNGKTLSLLFGRIFLYMSSI
jgi:hypothetical protein